jgi:hypothetical protein
MYEELVQVQGRVARIVYARVTASQVAATPAQDTSYPLGHRPVPGNTYSGKRRGLHPRTMPADRNITSATTKKQPILPSKASKIRLQSPHNCAFA